MNKKNLTTKEDGFYMYYVMNRKKLFYKGIYFALKSILPNLLLGDLIFILFQFGTVDRRGSLIYCQAFSTLLD